MKELANMSKETPIVLHISTQDAWRLHNKGEKIIQYESPSSYNYIYVPKGVDFSFFQSKEKSYALVLPPEDSKKINNSFKFLPLWGVLFSLLFSSGSSLYILSKITVAQEDKKQALLLIGVLILCSSFYCLFKVIFGLISGEKSREEVLQKYGL